MGVLLTQRRGLLAGGVGSLLSAAGWPALAAGFPQRAITLVVPFPAGGATDVLMRGIATLAAAQLGQPVLIDNKPGAAGVLGAQQLARARPDGHTLALLPEPVFRLPHLQKMAYDPQRDFSYVIQLAGYALSLAVRQDAPWRDWDALVADARQRPGHINYGSTGTHGTMHMIMEEISRRLGATFFHVPYKGEGEVITALLAGHIELGITAGTIAPLVEQGRARVLSVWTAERVPRWPEVPTLRELGLDMVANAPVGIAGPRGLPPVVVRRLHDAFRSALEAPQIQELLVRLNMERAYLGTAAYALAAQERYAEARLQLLRLGIAVQQR